MPLGVTYRDAKTYPEYSSLWRPQVRAQESGRLMSFYHGLGMFIFGMGALIVGAIVAYFIINQVMKDDEEKR